MTPKQWATQGLYRGDLTVLSAIAGGSAAFDESRVQRLRERRFIVIKSDGRIRMTVRGLAALMIRSRSRKRPPNVIAAP
jgi:hypothetical protein